MQEYFEQNVCRYAFIRQRVHLFIIPRYGSALNRPGGNMKSLIAKFGHVTAYRIEKSAPSEGVLPSFVVINQKTKTQFGPFGTKREAQSMAWDQYSMP